MTPNLTTEIQIDGGSLTGGGSAGGGAGGAGSDHEPTAHEDIINNGTKVTRSQSAALAGDTKPTSVHSQAVRRTRTVSSSRSVDEEPVAEEAEGAAHGSSEDLGLIRRTRQKVVNAFK